VKSHVEIIAVKMYGDNERKAEPLVFM